MALMRFRTGNAAEEDFSEIACMTGQELKSAPAADFFSDFNMEKMLAVFGNGSRDAGYALLYALCMRLCLARERHPDFAENANGGLMAVCGEFAGLALAVKKESEARQYDVALDVAVTALRFYRREWGKAKKLP